MSPTAASTDYRIRSPYFISNITRHATNPNWVIVRPEVIQLLIQPGYLHSSSPRKESSQSSQMTNSPHKWRGRMFEHISHRPTKGQDRSRLIISAIREYHICDIPLSWLMCKMSLSESKLSIYLNFPIQLWDCHTQPDVYTVCIRLVKLNILRIKRIIHSFTCWTFNIRMRLGTDQ